MFSPKKYECACPVCGADTEVVSEFLSTYLSVPRKSDSTPGRYYPAIPCKGVHTLREVRDALGLPVHAHEDPNRIVGVKSAEEK